MKTNRIAAFDILKGIAIFLVVMGHVFSLCIGDCDDNMTFRVIGAIHMPVFFFISGYFTYKLTEQGDFSTPNLKKRFYQLIVPFLVVSAIWSVYSPHCKLVGTHASSWPMLMTYYFKDGYWFTLALFEIILVYAMVGRLLAAVKNIWAQISILIAMYAVMVIAVPAISDEKAGYDPTGIGLLAQFFPVFMMGVFARKYIDGFKRLTRSYAVLLILVLAGIGKLLAKRYEAEMPWLFFIAQPLFHTLIILVAFCLVYRSDTERFATTRIGRWFTLLGNESLGIYLLHYFFLFPLTPLQEPMRALGLTFLPTPVVAAFFAFFIVLAALGANWAISKNKILAFLLIGKTIKEKQI